MGCLPSKNADSGKVVPTDAKTDTPSNAVQLMPVSTAPMTTVTTSKPMEADPRPLTPKKDKKDAVSSAPVKSLDKMPMPPIQSESSEKSSTKESHMPSSVSKAKPVAFEIPLDDTLFVKPASGRLPSLGLTNDDIKAKLANADARWKVGRDIDRVLLGNIEDQESSRRASRKARRVKPELSSNARPRTRQGREEDPVTLKQRLQEKEEQAEKNRQRELAKLQAKLAKMDRQVRRVQERKRILETESTEDVTEGWDVEHGLSTGSLFEKSSLEGKGNSLDDFFRDSSKVNAVKSGSAKSTDSGRGSSSASLESSRGSSGKSGTKTVTFAAGTAAVALAVAR
ncbi:hypothetical protein BC832DRAFT_458010 [Gaertneriomyces semiglobifer]|nr:hypothetical protein BC832DRAFT_458010 [Gaertneriomyces semiglobifer]